MKDSSIEYTNGGYPTGTKAAAGLFFFVNEVSGNFINFIHRIRDGRARVKGQSNVNRQVKKQCHQENVKPMPLERLIRTGFYPF